ncbi:cation/H(+) antiporter 4-like [Hibiscus syriacus]|nr:cation/H(+) antiporter 4-like [Hibiscus syriacus]
MALDKQTSLLLLPFHKKWTMDGTVVENENRMIRNLNFSVLHGAPWSIGILMGCDLHNWKKKSTKSSKSYSIDMIFLGGKDDREALTLAKRIARDPRVKLTLIHLISDQEPVKAVDWDMMLDVEMLKDFKENEVGDGCNVTFTQEVSNDGTQTAKFVRSITADYDMIIVGRRCGVESVQTTGLLEWSEYPELGVIGDLLASMVLDSRTPAAFMDGESSHLPYGNETLEICIFLPPKVNSAGVWEDTPSTILTYSVPLLELQILLIFLFTHLVHAIFKPLGVTYFASQMFAGLILGQIQGLRRIFYAEDYLGLETIETASLLGFSMFLFLMGVKMDLKMAFTTSGRSVLVGVISLLAPMLVGLAVYQTYKEPEQTKTLILERLMGITIESLTSSSVIAHLLTELKILNSELGRMALSSAVVCDISTLVLVYAISSWQRWTVSPLLAGAHAAVMVMFVLLIFFLFRPLMFSIIRGTTEGRPIKDVYIVIIVIVALGCGVFTTKFNQSALIGPFLIGLAVPEGPPLGSDLVNKFQCFVNGVFLATYVTTSSMTIKPWLLFTDLTTLKFSLLNIVFSFLAKFISCFVASFWGMMPFKDSLAFALIMSCKGVVELSYFVSFRDIEYMSKQAFSIFTLEVLVNATIIPILVKFLYDPDSRKYAGYQKRNIQHLKPNSELRILACVHRPEHVSALIDVLDITCPTKESPNVVYALHLIELTGRDTPIFIAHSRNEKVVKGSFKHILAFRQYEENNRGFVTVNEFTAISPPKLMHEDICTMALNKQTSFILLPFHRKWSIDGSIELENSVIRNLNCNVLNRAPCSVGILVTRSVDEWVRTPMKVLRSSFYSISMIFLGGRDDREALTLAKRMAYNPRVKLTVIHLITNEVHVNDMNWDMMLDAEILRDIKHNRSSNVCNVMYVQQVSNSGLQVARIVQSIADDYDLIIVGRRHGMDSVQTAGLSEWSEFPELGVIGDLFASTDIYSSASVLVVQQQNYVD